MFIFADYKRAFNSLSHAFIFEVLELFNFGPSLTNSVKVMLRGSESCISQNKTTSEFFQVNQGCRQGDCCSPLLFILCVEVLGIMIRKNKYISGYKIDNLEILIEQFAHDCTFVLGGSQASFDNCLNAVADFSSVSGFSLNIKRLRCFGLV